MNRSEDFKLNNIQAFILGVVVTTCAALVIPCQNRDKAEAVADPVPVADACPEVRELLADFEMWLLLDDDDVDLVYRCNDMLLDGGL